MLSPAVENYLKAIYKISERENGAVSTSSLAKELETSAASVTDMLRKLSEKKLIEYKKYKGARMTDLGNKMATALIRNHRLWEYFLVEKLHFGWEEVHEIAEELEHIKSEKLINRLDEYLDYPKFDPHGDPIPSKEGKITMRRQVALDSMREGEAGLVVRVQEHTKPFLAYLRERKIALGTRIQKLSATAYDGSINAEVNHEYMVTISQKAAQNILLKIVQ